MSQYQDVVPSSVRADGSVRKERKIRPGYVQKELVPRYQPPSLRRQQQQQQQNDKESEDTADAIPISAKSDIQTVKSPEHTATERPGELNAEKQTPAIDKKRNVYVPPHLRKAKAVAAERKEGKDNAHNILKSKESGNKGKGNDNDGQLADALEHMSLGSSKSK